MTNEERAQAYREVADWLLEHADIEPQIQVRLSKLVRDYADELDAPRPEPGTVVWWRYIHSSADFAIGVVAAHGDGVIDFEQFFHAWGYIECKPARIAGPEDVIIPLEIARNCCGNSTAAEYMQDEIRRAEAARREAEG